MEEREYTNSDNRIKKSADVIDYVSKMHQKSPNRSGYASFYTAGEKEDTMDDNKLLEKYMDKVDSDQRDLKVEMRESERRTEKRIESSDKRLDEHVSRIVGVIEEQNKKFDKIDDKMEAISNKVSEGFNEYRKFMWGIAISILLGIAAMILSIVK